MQLHKTAKKQRAFAIFKNYIPISFRLWTRQTKLSLGPKDQLQAFWSLLVVCVTEMIYLGPIDHTF